MPETDCQTVQVKLADRSYQIGIGPDLLANIDQFIDRTGQWVVITDQTVDSLYGERFCDSLSSSDNDVHRLVVADGEHSKSIEVVDRLWQEMIQIGIDRRATVIALGGGVVGDLAGFVAATYLRGLDLVQIPTSLLAQVDSSVGGKVGVNLPQGKNLVGAFWQPQQVIIDTQVLQTLDARQFHAGMAEVIKYAVILSNDFFDWLGENALAIEKRQPHSLQEMIARCCQFKADVVAEDERETTGQRAILNYGHTLGHAIEAVCGYGKFLHGEAIAIGMDFAIRLACQLGRVSDVEIERQRKLLTAFALPIDVPDVEPEKLIEAMYRDKKTTDTKLNFILPDRIGNVDLIRDVDVSTIEALLTRE